MYYANCEWYVDMGEHNKPLCERKSLRPAQCSECPVYIMSIENENAKLRELVHGLHWCNDKQWNKGACDDCPYDDCDPETVPIAGAGCADCDGCHCRDGESGRMTCYDALGNERHKAVCELRRVPDARTSENTYDETTELIFAALGLGCEIAGTYEGLNALRDRLIHLLGGDEPDSQKSPILADSDGEDGGDVTITDELRKFATDPLLGYASQELHVERISDIADRIDERFNMLQAKLIDYKALYRHYKDLYTRYVRERDILQIKLNAVREMLDE